jgi:hypothetical protein
MIVPRSARCACLAAGVFLTLYPAVSAAQEIPAALLAEMREISGKPVVHLALRGQNLRHENLSQAAIDTLDKQWRSEAKAADQPLIAQIMASPLSGYLIDLKARSHGLFTEIFVMDAKGLNAGQSSVTSDYWQGDEPKHQKTFQVGPDAVHFAKVETDENTGSRRQQVDFTISDRDTGKPIGAATFEIDLDELAERLNPGRAE